MSPSLVGMLALVAALVAALAAAGGAVLVRGSTAVPAAVWAAVACVVLAIELGLRACGLLAEPGTAAAVRLVSTALAVCPAMSLLGAKRPQHGVWQFIVATLAVVLALPAATATLVRPGAIPDVPLLVRFFVLGLAAVGWMNFAGTRRGVAAGLVTAGQLLLGRWFLPGWGGREPIPNPILDLAGVLAVAAGATLAFAAAARATRRRAAAGNRSPTDLAARIDGPFLALRETLGAAWTLRIAERFDALATHRGWPCRLSFTGLAIDAEPGAGGTLDAASWSRDASRGFHALMRRFVTDAWLRRHGFGDDSWPATAAAGTLPPR